ncbi:MAG: PD-(D/E)XK nuclease family protein [Lachnospiraceae bacterium]|nr:PD-(D/E)XK nuclease family protein [Lachnospiraceae bacterium]
MSNNQQTNEEALQNFLLDIGCLDELLPWTGKFNLFDVLKISRTEIRHSNMLGWILNPNENHGLGDLFLKGILQRLVENDMDGRYDVFNVLLMDLYSFSVLREWKNIDILLSSSDEKTVIAIENKVGSREHSNQLNRYRDILEKEYEGYTRIYIFLTPDGESPSDVENWDVLTYSDVVETLESISSRIEMLPDVDLMIKNYIDIVRRDIVEDQQLIDICNKIYNKHKKALDLIFENRTDGRTQMVDAIKDTLCNMASEGLIIYEEGGACTFRTTSMDKILPTLDNPISVWGNEYIYTYWFNVQGERFYGIFELTGKNIPEETMKKMQEITDILKPRDKRKSDFTFKRIFTTKWYDISEAEDLESAVDKAVRSAVKDILEMEKKLIEQLKYN